LPGRIGEDVCEELEQASKGGDWDPIMDLAPQLGARMREVVAYINRL